MTTTLKVISKGILATYLAEVHRPKVNHHQEFSLGMDLVAECPYLIRRTVVTSGLSLLVCRANITRKLPTLCKALVGRIDQIMFATNKSPQKQPLFKTRRI